LTPVKHDVNVMFVKGAMRIGEVAEKAGVTPRTIRHYESLGLVPPGAREGNGQHRYGEEMVARLRKIEQLKTVGLSLEEIGSVIDLYFEDPSGVRAKNKVLAILRAHLAETDAKLAALKLFRKDLELHVSRFEGWLARNAGR
jgi:MerR family copper efflux transcriptional regulator